MRSISSALEIPTSYDTNLIATHVNNAQLRLKINIPTLNY